MKSIIKNIFTSIIALTLLIGSSGFQVYKQTCSMHNFSAVSFIETPVSEKDYQVDEETDDCCKVEVEKITEPIYFELKPIESTNPISNSSQEFKCCFSSIESVQIQDNLFPPVEKKLSLIDFISINVLFDDTKIQKSEQIFFENNLPPPLFGKKFLQSVHQLKLDTPIC